MQCYLYQHCEVGGGSGSQFLGWLVPGKLCKWNAIFKRASETSFALCPAIWDPSWSASKLRLQMHLPFCYPADHSSLTHLPLLPGTHVYFLASYFCVHHFTSVEYYAPHTIIWSPTWIFKSCLNGLKTLVNPSYLSAWFVAYSYILSL